MADELASVEAGVCELGDCTPGTLGVCPVAAAFCVYSQYQSEELLLILPTLDMIAPAVKKTVYTSIPFLFIGIRGVG